MTRPFEGHADRECDEHHTVGPHRSWCFDCTEWCYPAEPCKGCELPALRAELARLRVLIADAQRCQETAEPEERMKCAMCCNDHIADLVSAVGSVPAETPPITDQLKGHLREWDTLSRWDTDDALQLIDNFRNALAPPVTSDDQCTRCGGTRTEPGSGDHDTAAHRDNPYTGEPCSACQQAPVTEIGHEKPNSRKLSTDGRSTMALVFCGDPTDHDPHVWINVHPVPWWDEHGNQITFPALCTGTDHRHMTVEDVLSRLVWRPSPGPLFYARHRLTLPGEQP